MTWAPVGARRAWPWFSIALAGSLVGPGSGGCRRPASAPRPLRQRVVADVHFDPRGVSQPVRVQIPPRTRSLTVVVEGEPDALYALAALRTSDGAEHVGLAPGLDVAGAMRARYRDERVGLMPGSLHQMIRLGLCTVVYPNRPGDRLPAGPVSLRVATTAPRAPVRVTLLMPEDDGGRVLPINLIRVVGGDKGLAAGGDPGALPYVREWTRIMAGAGITLEVRREIDVPARGLGDFMALSRPEEPPDSASARLARRAGELLGPRARGALDVFVVDALPPGIGGWSLGMPGPPLAGTWYSGVVVARLDQGPALARVLAHETAHFLGLFHVEDVGVSGRRYPDPLDDTRPGAPNLMAEHGTAVTPDQAYVLSRHPLLRASPRRVRRIPRAGGPGPAPRSRRSRGRRSPRRSADGSTRESPTAR